MSDVQHVKLPSASLFVKGKVMMTTRNESLSAPTPVVEELKNGGKVALWGAANDFPKRVYEDKQRCSLMSAVIERKVNMLISGGLRYGKVVIDQQTGMDRMIPQRVPEIQQWMRDVNINLFLREALTDWYTYYNVFVELQMGRGLDRIVDIGCQDASHVRLGVMNKKAEIDKAYIADWNNGGTDSTGFVLPALDPYSRVAQQVLTKKHDRMILPIRHLNDGRFYYGLAPWNGLRANGWLDVAMRVPELKKMLLEGLMHIKYHFEVDERFWLHKYPDFNSKKEEDRIALMKKEVNDMVAWLQKGGQGGAYMSTMKSNPTGQDQFSLVKIHEKKMTTSEGAYIEDSQEADFIICRDMGLKPSLIGISPSKSGSSPGSGSEDRVARTNHILDCKSDQDMLLECLNVVRDVNGWPQDIEFWFSNYYAATLDRTMQVTNNPTDTPAR